MVFRMECSWISRSTPAIEENIFHSLPFCLLFFSFKGNSVFSNHTLYWKIKLPIPSAHGIVGEILMSIMFNLIAY